MGKVATGEVAGVFRRGERISGGLAAALSAARRSCETNTIGELCVAVALCTEEVDDECVLTVEEEETPPCCSYRCTKLGTIELLREGGDCAGLTVRLILLSLPLEERFKKWFSEGPEAHRFSALMHLAPECSEDDMLKLKSVAIPSGSLEKALIPLAVRTYRFTAWRDWNSKEPDDWKLKDTDEKFKQSHPDIVEEQRRDWVNREKDTMDALLGCRKGGSAKSFSKSSAVNSSIAADRSAKGGTKVKSQNSTIPSTMSKETRGALPKALEELFSIHKVCR
ncbi:hypothetical protein H6P81_018176 [Aristolochia fimbriata]|uniref:Uncharacterized protein n=1 Tax=Aristolochia fimbriata TaxID=158543 RepID=A0AAV7E3C9_ARIFI|nr:hypothetical protein H6P81_018176 [Aristolochia fimbriata]